MRNLNFFRHLKKEKKIKGKNALKNYL